MSSGTTGDEVSLALESGLLAAIVAVRDGAALEPVFDRLIDNGRMLRNFVQILRSGAVGRRSLGSRPKRLVQRWLETATIERLQGRLKWVNSQLEGKSYLTGEQFTVADGYLFNITAWAKPTGFDLSPFTRILAWRERVAARPAVQAALGEHGLS